MVDAPEKIRVAQDSDGFWTCREAISGSQEYVRADLVAELAAENERLRNALDGYGKLDAELAIAERRIEALKQEVENWKTSAAGWQKLAKVDAEAIASTGAVKEAGAKLAKAVFGVDLVAHPRDTNPVDAHETANVSDKPEGQQEPVAWLAEGYGYQRAFIEREAAEKMARGGTLTPLYTRPSEQAVTEAMLRSAIIAYRDTPEYDHHIALRNALKAAMEAGRHE